jgi:3-phenylpropionate/trans-cinnamate dioxygenase ferredoxin reductase subunit
VIIGAGQAGSDLAVFLRQARYGGPITLLGEEPYLPYRRPPLSKTFLAGEAELDSLLIRHAAGYEEQHVDCRIDTRVESVDRAARCVRLAGGATLAYEKLVIATGGRARRLGLPRAEAPNVHYIRTIADILRLKPQFVSGRRVVIVGGGYIGLEAASVAIKKGLRVTVVESLPRVLARVTAPEVSQFYEAAHRRRGVEIRTGASVRSLEGAGRVDGVVLEDGTRLPADLVIVGIGLIPETALAERAGLEASDGIVVDAHLRTGDQDIYAIGDCANHPNAFLGRRLRVESVPNATEQARACAANLIGIATPFSAIPWFWSDQFDLKLQMVGLSGGYDRLVLRGCPERESFVAFYLREGVMIAADAVNRAADFMIAKRLIAQRVRPDSTVLADESRPLKLLAH